MIKPDFSEKNIKIAFSTLDDGNMRIFGAEDEDGIIENQANLGASINLNRENIARIHTTYDTRTDYTRYFEITPENLSDFVITAPESTIPISDGLYTRIPGIGLLLPIADCLGIVVYDPVTEILGLIHSGRQNLEQDGATKFIENLAKEGVNPADLKVYFSPCAKNYKIEKLNQTIPEAARAQLLKAGVSPDNIEESEIDVATDLHFPSNSAGDKTTRFAIIASK
jgi:copper oxidase (laccase) domain-containing protein